MSFLEKIAKTTATYPWEDPKSEEDLKKYYAPEHRKTDLKKAQKANEFREKTISLVISVDNYLANLDECPDNKGMVMISKAAVKTMVAEANTIRKLRDEWVALDRQYLSQLAGK